MKNFSITLLLLAFISCKNTANKAAEKDTADTAKAYTDDVHIAKKDTIPVQKTTIKDTIRNYKETQMSEDFFQKAIIDLRDSSFTVYQNIRADYRIFGYQKPDTNARKMILFSVFTSDVKDNPYQCPLGAYYYSGAMGDTKIKYIQAKGAFVEAHLIKDKQLLPQPIYILKDWVEFEERN